MLLLLSVKDENRAKDFANPHYRKKAFALSVVVEKRCEKHIIIACGAFLAYGNPEKVNQVLIRVFAMYFAEVCIVDLVKSKLLERLFDISPFPNTRVTWIELSNLAGWIGLDLFICYFTKLALSELGMKTII